MPRQFTIRLTFTAEELRNLSGRRGANHIGELSDTRLLAAACRVDADALADAFRRLLAEELGFWGPAEKIARGSDQKGWLADLTSERGLDRWFYCAGAGGRSVSARIDSFLDRLWQLGYDVEASTPDDDGFSVLFLVGFDPDLAESRGLARALYDESWVYSLATLKRDDLADLIESLDDKARSVLAGITPHLRALNERLFRSDQHSDIIDVDRALEAAKSVADAGTAEFVLHMLPEWDAGLSDLIDAAALVDLGRPAA